MADIKLHLQKVSPNARVGRTPSNRGACATIPQVTTIQGKAHWYGIFVFVQIKEKNKNKTTPFGGKDEEQSVFPRISVTWLYRTVVEPFWRAETV